jgi:hypothetical protein
MSVIQSTPIQWDFITDKIRREQCVLVAGPELFKGAANTDHGQGSLLAHLDVSNNPHVYRYYADDDFFLFDDPYKRTLLCHQIKSYYDGLSPQSSVNLLAQIPFHIFLLVAPHQLLQRSFDHQSFAYQSGYYVPNEEPNIIKVPSRKNPLIYNAFGSVESEESILLTHDDLFNYFKSVFAQRSMPEQLKIQLRNIKTFIFLGVPFDKWYMQLLMRELDIHNRKHEFTRFAAGQAAGDEIETLCLDQFRMHYISHDIPGFIKELHSRFTAEELRQASAEGVSRLGDVRELIGEGDLDAAVDLMVELTEDTALEDDLLQLAGRVRKFKKRVNRGILSQEDQRLQDNQLTNTLIELIEEAKKIGL